MPSDNKWSYLDCIHNPAVKVTVCVCTINLSLIFKQILSIHIIMNVCLLRDLYTSSISIGPSGKFMEKKWRRTGNAIYQAQTK